MQALVAELNFQILGFLVVFFRIAAFTALLPALGEQSIPARIKLAIAFVFSLAILPLVDTSGVDPLAPSVISLEVLNGAILGIGLRLFVMALHTAGVIAAQSTSLSQLLGGSAAEPLPAMGHILVISGLALAMVTGLHTSAVEFLVISYDILPIGSFFGPQFLSSWGIQRVAEAFSLAFILAAPFILLSLMYNIILGAINKAMPQLMVAFIGAPFITAGGLILLLLSAPLMLSSWLRHMNTFIAAPGW